MNQNDKTKFIKQFFEDMEKLSHKETFDKMQQIKKWKKAEWKKSQKMKTYRITHFENDGFNNFYAHHSFKAENIEKAEEELKSYVDCKNPIFVDHDIESTSFTFDMFPEQTQEEKENDEAKTETWTVEEIESEDQTPVYFCEKCKTDQPFIFVAHAQKFFKFCSKCQHVQHNYKEII